MKHYGGTFATQLRRLAALVESKCKQCSLAGATFATQKSKLITHNSKHMGILQVFTLLGALGMFLYGMNLMSSGLQKAAGDKLRSLPMLPSSIG